MNLKFFCFKLNWPTLIFQSSFSVLFHQSVLQNVCDLGRHWRCANARDIIEAVVHNAALAIKQEPVLAYITGLLLVWLLHHVVVIELILIHLIVLLRE